MKKLFLFAAIAFSSFAVNAQTTTATPDNSNMQTPGPVSTRFTTDHPNTQASWTMDGSNYRANYTDGSVHHGATYDAKGKLISTDEQLGAGAYPAEIGDYYTKTYPNETYEVWSSTDAKGEKTFYTTRNSETVWFDKSGKYKSTMKTKKK